MDALLADVRRAGEEAADFPRPWLLAAVVDTSRYGTAGASFVGVDLGGALVWAAYRDGPEPGIGDLVQLKRANRHADSWFLALPLPQASGCGLVYVSAYSLADASWHIIRCDTAVGNVWQEMGAHPTAGSFARRPLLRIDTRLFTWGCATDYSSPGDLYYSDDNGATWVATGIAVVNMSRTRSAPGGEYYAVDGADLWRSVDGGATWATDTGPGGVLLDVRRATGDSDGDIGVYTAAGVYNGLVSGGVSGSWVGPYTPAPGATTAAILDSGGGVTTFSEGTGVYAADRNVAPGAAAFLNPLVSSLTPGATWRAGNFTGFGDYHSAADHPASLTPDVAGYALIHSDGLAHGCAIVGLDDATTGAGHTRYVYQFDGPGVPWVPLDTRQVGDLGAAFVPSPDGLSP